MTLEERQDCPSDGFLEWLRKRVLSHETDFESIQAGLDHVSTACGDTRAQIKEFREWMTDWVDLSNEVRNWIDDELVMCLQEFARKGKLQETDAELLLWIAKCHHEDDADDIHEYFTNTVFEAVCPRRHSPPMFIRFLVDLQGAIDSEELDKKSFRPLVELLPFLGKICDTVIYGLSRERSASSVESASDNEEEEPVVEVVGDQDGPYYQHHCDLYSSILRSYLKTCVDPKPVHNPSLIRRPVPACLAGNRTCTACSSLNRFLRNPDQNLAKLPTTDLDSREHLIKVVAPAPGVYVVTDTPGNMPIVHVRKNFRPEKLKMARWEKKANEAKMALQKHL
ncbi:hypothetical protein QBC35DRAFT_542913 [Podospora australis]|uniref:Uncharacterized protein n=1 Tax=Podospora australis TaxID=1536484 RepID=A0AAN6WNH7_9PEZI|nr:hypothetical protein QBC35DRAFT_542913 [Podospora australis]